MIQGVGWGNLRGRYMVKTSKIMDHELVHPFCGGPGNVTAELLRLAEYWT